MGKFHEATAPVNVRMPVSLLAELREQALREHKPYQRLMRELVKQGLAARAGLAEMEAWSPLANERLTREEIVSSIREMRDRLDRD